MGNADEEWGMQKEEERKERRDLVSFFYNTLRRRKLIASYSYDVGSERCFRLSLQR